MSPAVTPSCRASIGQMTIPSSPAMALKMLRFPLSHRLPARNHTYFQCFFIILFRTDIFSFAPFRSLHDSCGPARIPISRHQLCYIFTMYFNNSTFCDNATFKIVALTNGFGYIFDLPTFRASSAGGAATSQFRIGPI